MSTVGHREGALSTNLCRQDGGQAQRLQAVQQGTLIGAEAHVKDERDGDDEALHVEGDKGIGLPKDGNCSQENLAKRDHTLPVPEATFDVNAASGHKSKLRIRSSAKQR